MRGRYCVFGGDCQISAPQCCGVLLASTEWLGGLGESDPVEDESNMLCPPLGAMPPIFVNECTPRCNLLLCERLLLCDWSPMEAGRIQHTVNRRAACFGRAGDG